MIPQCYQRDNVWEYAVPWQTTQHDAAPVASSSSRQLPCPTCCHRPPLPPSPSPPRPPLAHPGSTPRETAAQRRHAAARRRRDGATHLHNVRNEVRQLPVQPNLLVVLLQPLLRDLLLVVKPAALHRQRANVALHDAHALLNLGGRQLGKLHDAANGRAVSVRAGKQRAAAHHNKHHTAWKRPRGPPGPISPPPPGGLLPSRTNSAGVFEQFQPGSRPRLCHGLSRVFHLPDIAVGDPLHR